MGATYQSYQNGLTGAKTLEVAGHNINATKDAIIYLKSVAAKNNLTSQNQIILKGILDQLDELNNKSDILIKDLANKNSNK